MNYVSSDDQIQAFKSFPCVNIIKPDNLSKDKERQIYC